MASAVRFELISRTPLFLPSSSHLPQLCVSVFEGRALPRRAALQLELSSSGVSSVYTLKHHKQPIYPARHIDELPSDPSAIAEASTMAAASQPSSHSPVAPSAEDFPADGTGQLLPLRGLLPPRLTGCPGVVKLDPWLEPFSDALRRRFSKAQEWIKTINEHEGGMDKFSNASPANSPREM